MYNKIKILVFSTYLDYSIKKKVNVQNIKRMVHFFFGKIKVEVTFLKIVPLVFMKSQFLPSGKENDNFALDFF